MNLTDSIESAELQFKQILEDFFITEYNEKTLPSHGIDHHRRVWSYSKELLTLLTGKKPATFSQLPSKLIIASYLHDIGMSVDSGIRHGKHSRHLCIRFLDQNNLPLNEYQDVLEAIENHDIKDYTCNIGVNDLLTLLSVADDLDAFGFQGIYRYSEIYLTRGIDPVEIGHMIRYNASRRFDNFFKTPGFSEELVLKHKKRFDILDNFFQAYSNEVGSYKFGGQHPSGYCGVVEIFLYLINNKKSLKDIYREPEKYLHDSVINWFFDGLASESVDCGQSIK